MVAAKIITPIRPTDMLTTFSMMVLVFVLFSNVSAVDWAENRPILSISSVLVS